MFEEFGGRRSVRRTETEVAGRSRVATGWGRFVLAVALLVGIVLMHVLGHPGDHAAPTHSSGKHMTTTTHAVAAVEHVAADAVHASHPDPAHGAGVAAACVAVLGAGIGLLLVVRRALARGCRGAEALLPAVRLAHALRAIPPPAPPRSLLTRLSLLRI
ncbi:DUF6153 family protein [Streptomyces roseoviridis]|uniref:DUF6153 family protein n=2 Tax=Streptomyces roseoviridis TaxID=67361 RepID=A0ABV5QUW7_9ACTN